MNKIKILIAEDAAIYVYGLQSELQKVSDFDVVGIATNGKELCEQVPKLKPDVILTDIRMHPIDGLEAVKTILDMDPEMKIIALTCYEEMDLVVMMLRLGAVGYIDKGATVVELVDAIREVYKGGNYHCKKTAQRITAMIKSEGDKLLSKSFFTGMETKVVELICKDRSNKEIAEELKISVNTVEAYRKKIIRKMGVKGTVGVVKYAYKFGLVHV